MVNRRLKWERKKAFVFDTNFIIQNKDMTKVVSSLQDSFAVYVTQVSVEERIAHQCRELKDKYDRHRNYSN